MSGPSNALSIGQKIPPNPLKKKKKTEKERSIKARLVQVRSMWIFLTTKVDFVSRPTYNYISDNFLGR